MCYSMWEDTLTALVILAAVVVAMTGVLLVVERARQRHEVAAAPPVTVDSGQAQRIVVKDTELFCAKIGVLIDSARYPGITYPPCPELCEECTPNLLGDTKK